MPNRKYENNEQELMGEEKETLKWSLLPLRAPLGPGNDVPNGPEGLLRLWSPVFPQLLLSPAFLHLLLSPAFPQLLLSVAWPNLALPVAGVPEQLLGLALESQD